MQRHAVHCGRVAALRQRHPPCPSPLHRQRRRLPLSVCAAGSVLGLVPYAISSGIQFAKIKPISLPADAGAPGGEDERGMAATFQIAPGECIASAPATAAMRTHPGDAPPSGSPLSQAAWRSLPWYARLGLLLLAEVKAGGASRWAEYVHLLPRRVDIPVLWTQSEVEQLACSYFTEQVQEQRAEWAALELKLKGHLDATGTSAEQLRWALSIVRSRAFAAPYVPVPLSVAPKLLATATVASAAVTAAAGTAAGAGVIALGTAAAAGLYAWLMRSAATQEQHALCPLMDLFNHDGRQQSEVELELWSDRFRVVATQHWEPGQDVAIAYGPFSADALLQLYGFVEANGPHERYLVRTLPAALHQLGVLSIGAAAPSALLEVAFTRDGLPAAAAAELQRLCHDARGSSAADMSVAKAAAASDVAVMQQPYAALSAVARRACMLAVQAERAALAVDVHADEELLRALQGLPAARRGLEAATAEVEQQRAELAALREEAAAAMAANLAELQLATAAAQPGAEQSSSTPHSNGSSNSHEAEASTSSSVGASSNAAVLEQHQAAIDQAQQRLCAAESAADELLQQVSRWQLLAEGEDTKVLAVQYRLCKAKLLDELAQLQQQLAYGGVGSTTA